MSITFRFASLGSGSRGNATLVETHQAGYTTRLLVDCGFGPRELAKRLLRFDLQPQDIQAVLITHEHTDHMSGLAAGQKKFGWKVYLTAGSSKKLKADTSAPEYKLIPAQHKFTVGDIQVTAFPVPHDANEPCQFTFRFAGRKFGVLSDLGRVTPHVIDNLFDCDAMLLECNHDEAMLARGVYPAHLKRRVGGGLGHLSNAQAAYLVAQISARHKPQLSPVNLMALAHLSEQNNSPELALAAINAVKPSDCNVVLTNQQNGSEWLEVTKQSTSDSTAHSQHTSINEPFVMETAL